MNIKAAKDLDMVDYLSRLGYQPTRVSHPSYWYKSPLRDEKTASFRINRKTNRWRDFATGAGGNLVDFGIQYFKCSISDFLQKISGPGMSVALHQRPANNSQELAEEEKHKIKIVSINPITSLPLIRYYRDRRIPDIIACQNLQEAVYELNGKSFYALAFKNDKGGYELRNRHFKGSSSPKESTFIDNGTSTLAVFEGFFNFLSHRAMLLRQEQLLSNYLILNSTAFFDRKIPQMMKHKKVFLYLDNDKTGQKCGQQALSLDKEKFNDQCSLYKGYDDLNDWLINIGKAQRPSLRQTP